jgi:hypothetical protein
MRLRRVCVLVLGVASAVAQESPGTITGTVVDAAGLQVPGTTVTIVSPISLETITDNSGEFAIHGLAPGAYEVRVQRPGFVARELEVPVEVGKETELGRVVLEVKIPPCVGKLRRTRISEATLPASAKARVSGSARGETYGALRYLTVTLLVAGTSNVIATSITGTSGQFRFADVKPGVYDVAVSFEAATLTKLRNLRVREGHELEIHLTWEQPRGQICL